jgi:hypothetical protein
MGHQRVSFPRHKMFICFIGPVKVRFITLLTRWYRCSNISKALCPAILCFTSAAPSSSSAFMGSCVVAGPVVKLEIADCKVCHKRQMALADALLCCTLGLTVVTYILLFVGSNLGRHTRHRRRKVYHKLAFIQHIAKLVPDYTASLSGRQVCGCYWHPKRRSYGESGWEI